MGQQIPSVAVAGCGYWGKNLVRNFHELGSLKAMSDVDESRLETLASVYHVETSSCFSKLLSNPEIQAVAIATPAALHFELAKKAMLAGKDVFVEKPLALRVEEGEELVEIARKHERVLMVGHILYYHPAVMN